MFGRVVSFEPNPLSRHRWGWEWTHRECDFLIDRLVEAHRFTCHALTCFSSD